MRVICVTVLTVLFAISISWALERPTSIKVTLLGTGGPEFFPDRLGIATLIEVNGQYLLFDVGR